MNRKLRLFAEIIAVLAILLSSCVKDSQPGKDDNTEVGPGGDNPVENTSIHPWFELPAVDYEKSGNYLVSKSDETLYFAHHYCAGGEKGPDGKVARNFSVCYSSKYHCPVWVAAPLHQMYKASGRHEAYKNDPATLAILSRLSLELSEL